MEEVGSAVFSGAGSDGSDYEHWPDDATQITSVSSISGYNSYNGLREFTYQPANSEAKKAEPPAAAQAQPVPYVFQPPVAQPAAPPAPPAYAAPAPQFYGGYGYSAYVPHMAYPTPGYYGYPGGDMPYCPPGYTPVYHPAAPPAEEKKKEEKKAKKPELRKWQGRTKAEVEEDNMKIAKEEGAWDKRKVEPVGLATDQMVWCVEVDGGPTLR